MKLAETISIRAGERTIPFVEAGAELPLTKKETLSTARDGQSSVRCELLAGALSVAFVEVGVTSAPRGVPKVALELRIDGDGSVSIRLRAEDGEASASSSVATMG
jgi:molecular chaperone DnaK (HSP70)